MNTHGQKARGVNDVCLILSKLELRVAMLARAGLSRWEIAAVLGVQEGTVKSQLERVTAKLKPGWKENPALHWPQFKEEAHKAIGVLRNRVVAGVQGVAEGIAAAAGGNKSTIDPAVARQVLEGGLSRWEAGILQLQGQPSAGGREYLQKARSFQFQLIALGNKDRVMYVSSSARFWLKPALAVLVDNKFLRFWHSDALSEPYRPSWLPFISGGRARGTKAAYYKTVTGTAGERARSCLDFWMAEELEGYVARLHARMYQRYLALKHLSCLAGKTNSPPLPDLEELLTEARRALGLD